MRISWPRIPLSISYFGHSKLAQSLETVRNFCIFKTEIILRHLLLRFEEIQKEALGYNPVAVAVVSVSGWHGDNMIKASTYMPWYKVTDTTVSAEDAESIRDYLTSSGAFTNVNISCMYINVCRNI